MRTEMKKESRRARQFAVVCILLWVFAVSGAARADTTLTVDQAVEMALSRNLSLERAGIDAAALKRVKDTRWNVLVPGIETSVSLNRANESPSPLDSGYRYTAAGSAGLRLTLSPADFTGMKQAVTDYERGLISFENARTLLELSVRKVFYGLLLVRENRDLVRQNILTAEKRMLQAEANYKNGLVPELDALSARVSLENLRPSLDQETAVFEEQLGLLKMYLGIDPAENVFVEGSITPNLSADFSAVSASPSRLDIQELIRIKTVTILARDAARQRAFLPQLSLGWAYSPALANPFPQERWKKDNLQDGGIFTVALSLSLDNLLPGSAARNSIAAFDEAIQKQESQILELSRQTVTETETLKKKIEISRKTIAALELNTQLAEKTYALTEEAYRQGTRELLVLENAGNELQNARLKTAQEKYNFITLILDLEYTLGEKPGTLYREE
jgi:outer membrane protein TolC